MLKRHRVAGLDLSSRQLDLAKLLVPQAMLVQGDATTLPFPAASFDAVVALFCLVHIPRAEQSLTLQGVVRCLRPGGLLPANFGTGGSHDSVQHDWLGVPMFLASFDPATNERMVRDASMKAVASRLGQATPA